MRSRARVAWWVGWHPRYAVVAGAFLGLVVGNVLVTWAVRATMLRGGLGEALSPLKALVGGGGTFLFVTAALPVVGSVFVGALVGAGAWLAGVWAVESRAAGVLGKATDGGPGGGDTYQFSVVTDDRGPPLLSYGRSYQVTRVRLDESALSVTVQGCSLPGRDSTNVEAFEIPYAAVETVTDAEKSLRIETAEESFVLSTVGRHADLLAGLRTRLPESATIDARSTGDGPTSATSPTTM